VSDNISSSVTWPGVKYGGCDEGEELETKQDRHVTSGAHGSFTCERGWYSGFPFPLLHPWILLGVHAAMHSWSLTTRERKLQRRAMAAATVALI